MFIHAIHSANIYRRTLADMVVFGQSFCCNVCCIVSKLPGVKLGGEGSSIPTEVLRCDLIFDHIFFSTCCKLVLLDLNLISKKEDCVSLRAPICSDYKKK